MSITIGGTVYIKCRDCKLLKRPSASDPSYGFLVLQPGTPVQWMGIAPEDRAFHKIQYKGEIGYTLGQNLAAAPAQFDLSGCKKCNGSGKIVAEWGNSQGFVECPLCKGAGGWGKPMSSQAFASSGGTKA